jgi:hypothetical protein
MQREHEGFYPAWAGLAVICVTVVLLFLALIFAPGEGNGPSCAKSMFLECLVCEDGEYGYYPPGTPYGPGSPNCYHDPEKFRAE